jgi:mono/diheme cytochrome c family protein
MNAGGKAIRRAVLPLGIRAAFVIGGWSVWLGHTAAARAENAMTNPYLGQPDAITEGNDIYHGKCIICHGLAGGRGPNLFASRLTDEQFMDVVINGRKGTLMPALGFQLSPDDVWKIHAFIKANPRGLRF